MRSCPNRRIRPGRLHRRVLSPPTQGGTMSRSHRRLLAGVVGLLLVGSASPALARATEDAPPVTVPDEVTLLPGGSAYVDVLANDSDDLDQQALCRARG